MPSHPILPLVLCGQVAAPMSAGFSPTDDSQSAVDAILRFLHNIKRHIPIATKALRAAAIRRKLTDTGRLSPN